MAEAQQMLRKLKSFDTEIYNPGSAQVRDDALPTLETVVGSGFTVDFDLVYEVHGGYDTGEEDNASLLVVRVVPRPNDLKRQFLWLKVTFTVLPDGAKGKRGDEDEYNVPLLTSMEPASEGDQFADVFTTNESCEIALKGTLQAQIWGVTPGAETSRTSKSEFKTHHLLKVKSRRDNTYMALSKANVNRVRWELQAANKEDGIGDSFTVALLIKRPKGSKFHLEGNTDEEIGVLSEKVKKFVPSGLRSKKEPSLLAVFGPARFGSIQRLPKGIDEKNLHLASRDNTIKRMDEVGLHLPEQGRLVRFEQGIVGSRLELENLSKPEDQTFGTDAGVDKHGVVVQASVPHQVEHHPAPVLASQPSAVYAADHPLSKLESKEGSDMIRPGPVFSEPCSRRTVQGPPPSTARMDRLRKMAALYDRLADLLREEARESLSAEERAFADEVERQAR